MSQPAGVPPSGPAGPGDLRAGTRRRRGLVVGLVLGGLVAAVALAVPFAMLLSQLVAPAEPVARADPPVAATATPSPGPDPRPTAPPRPSPSATGEAGAGPSREAPGPDVQPSGPGAGTPDAPAPGGPAFPTEPSPTATAVGTGLLDNGLYSVVEAPASGRCEDPPLDRPGVPDDQLGPLAEEIVTCLVTALSPALAEQGIELTTPSVQTFDADVDTPCGTVTVEQYPAYYCSFDTTIYLNELTDDTAINYAEVTRGYWLIVAHELGHHVQQVSGIFPRYSRIWAEAGDAEQHELTRRLELQATCFAGVQLNLMATTLELDAGTAAELERYALANNDEATGTLDHGDAESMSSWLERGFLRGWASFGHCRTWAADPADVS